MLCILLIYIPVDDQIQMLHGGVYTNFRHCSDFWWKTEGFLWKKNRDTIISHYKPLLTTIKSPQFSHPIFFTSSNRWRIPGILPSHWNLQPFGQLLVEVAVEVASHCMVTDGPKDLQGLIFGCDRELFDRYFKILLDTSSFFFTKKQCCTRLFSSVSLCVSFTTGYMVEIVCCLVGENQQTSTCNEIWEITRFYSYIRIY